MDKQQLFSECIRILQITPIRRSPEELLLLNSFARTVTFFRDLGEQSPEILQRCVQVLSYRTIKNGEILFKVGDSGSLFYVILRGSVGINIRLPNPEDPSQFELKEVNVLKVGASFGELALINDAKRTATIVAKEDCIFAVMEKHNYKSILGAQEMAKIQSKIQFLCSFPFFSSWSFREIKTISYHFEPVTVTLNQTILKQNEFCNHFYVVRDGEFEVQFIHKLKMRSICILGPGEFFGEEAFLSKEGQFLIKPSSIFVSWAKTKCNVVCKSEVGVAYKITREDIQKRFWDSKTQVVFLSLLSSIHHFRAMKAVEYIQEIEDRQAQIKTDDGLMKFTKPISRGVVKQFNMLSHRNSNGDGKDAEFQFYKAQEMKAIEQFKTLFKDRNCSHAQVRTFFDQKNMASQNYIDKNSYYRLFFRFPIKASKHHISITNKTTKPSYQNITTPTTTAKLVRRFKHKINRYSEDGTQTQTLICSHSPASQRSMNERRLKTHIF